MTLRDYDTANKIARLKGWIENSSNADLRSALHAIARYVFENYTGTPVKELRRVASRRIKDTENLIRQTAPEYKQDTETIRVFRIALISRKVIPPSTEAYRITHGKSVLHYLEVTEDSKP
jgi:hypothetical protein